MRARKALWWGLPLVVVLGLATWAAYKYVQTGGVVSWRALWNALRPPAEQAAPSPQQDRREAGPPAVPAFAFTAVREGERVSLSGSAPDSLRAFLVEQARQAVPGAVVAESLQAADAPSRFGDVAALAVRQLAQLPFGAITIRGDVVSVHGKAQDRASYDAVIGALRGLPEGFRSDVAGFVPPLARPYTWSVKSTERGLELSGHVPSEAARRQLRAAAAAAFPDKQLVEDMHAASGLADEVDFAAATRFALTQVASMQTGTVELVDAVMSLRGEVVHKDALAAISGAVQTSLPAGLRPGAVALTLARPSPYLFTASRDASAVVLSGYCPDEATRSEIHAQIRRRFLTEQIVDKLRVADGAPRHFVGAVSFGLDHLSRLASGALTVSDASVRVSGESLYEQSAEKMIKSISAVSLPGWTAQADVRVRSSEPGIVPPSPRPQP
jgi:OmpA-OmpF porin, OOP family